MAFSNRSTLRASARKLGRNDSFFTLRWLGLGPNRLWLGVFVIWSVFLTGALEDFTGSPGVLQAYRLNKLLESKRARLGQVEDELVRLRQDRDALESNGAFQEREVRRVLGYVAPDEMVFDFSGE